ncbi:MAG: class I SAM-dependent methyltransferase [Desulfobulbaceae bacterium]|nr:class I SAM-dependent methyltransferase [Desulfobulbaceae bacterium]
MTGKSGWDERYSGNEYHYGTEPNAFLVEHYGLLQNPVLSLSEGEGRNAVFLATKGFQVLGVDFSEIGLHKAQELALANKVAIQTTVADMANYTPEPNKYGSVISIFAHYTSAIRKRLYPLVEQALKPGGIFLLEAYTEAQLPRSTGGPKEIDKLLTADKLTRDFSAMETILLKEMDREVHEGDGHTGLGSVIQFIARRKG